MVCGYNWLALGDNSVSWWASYTAVSEMSYDSIVPKDVWENSSVAAFVAWIETNIENPRYRKYILVEWTKYHGIKLTGQMVRMSGAV